MTLMTRLRPALAAAVLATVVPASQAAFSFSWSLDDWEPELAVGATLVLKATLFNDFSSTEPLLGARLLSQFGEGIGDDFIFRTPLPTLAAQLEHVELDPGESFSFVFGSLEQKPGGAAPGEYYGGGFTLAFTDIAGREHFYTPDRSLRVTVNEGDPTEIPEPPVPALIAAALAALAWRNTRRGRLAAGRRGD